MSDEIESVTAREILDSRGNPTVEVEMSAAGVVARASVSSGASTGSREAVEHRDGDPHRFGGKGVLEAVHSVKTAINEVLRGVDVRQQEEIDRRLIALDGSENKSRLGPTPCSAFLWPPPASRRNCRSCRCIVIWAASAPTCCRCPA